MAASDHCPSCTQAEVVAITERVDSLLLRWNQKYYSKELPLALQAAREESHRITPILVNAYCGPDRRYHSLRHILDALDRFDEVKDTLRDPDAVEFAILFHDSIYGTGQTDAPFTDEAQSGKVAAHVANELDRNFDFQQRIRQLIQYTDHKTPVPEDDLDAQTLVDIDLAYLGYDEETFDRNTRDIRFEYRRYSDEQWRMGRADFYRTMLARLDSGDHLFQTSYFRAKYEAQARRNLQHGLDVITVVGALVP